jgi:putative molybdopterin biosynthesis protein
MNQKTMSMSKYGNTTEKARFSRFLAWKRTVRYLPPVPNEEFYSAQELADILRVNIMTIYRYIKAGKLEAYKIGKEFRIDKKEFLRFLDKVKNYKL